MKHHLKTEYYIRYADDFVIFSHDRAWLAMILPRIQEFLRLRLTLDLHPHKVSLATIASGVDFLGWVHFSDQRVLRTSTKQRMMRRIAETQKPATLRSYLGLLNHGNAYKLRRSVLAEY